MQRTVLVVDDHDGFRNLAKKLLDGTGYLVVGEAATAAQAVNEARRLLPDVVLLDIGLPDRDGFSTASEILEATPTRPIVLLISSRDASDYGPRVRECGARAFIAKANLTVETIGAALAQ